METVGKTVAPYVAARRLTVFSLLLSAYTILLHVTTLALSLSFVFFVHKTIE
jgi:hypothetical protein